VTIWAQTLRVRAEGDICGVGFYYGTPLLAAATPACRGQTGAGVWLTGGRFGFNITGTCLYLYFKVLCFFLSISAERGHFSRTAALYIFLLSM